MRLEVIGQAGDGPVKRRFVSFHEFLEAWGPWAAYLLQHAVHQAIEIDGRKVRIRVIRP